MARPIKNNCDYFPHDAGMRNHKKVKAIRGTFPNGYAIWSMILEHLTGSDGNVFPYTDLEFELMSGDFGFSVTEIRGVVDYCIRIEMLFNDNGFIKSESLDERLAPVFEKRNKAKELSKQQLRENGKYVTETPQGTVITVTETPQSKGKEIKGNQMKKDEKSMVAVSTATFEQREKDLMTKLVPFIETYGKEMLREFYNYWTERNENGKKMRFEMEKVFDVSKRLVTWQKRNKTFKHNGKQPTASTTEEWKYIASSFLAAKEAGTI